MNKKNLSDIRCEKGKRILHHKWRLSEDGDRPASNYIGLVEDIDVQARQGYFKVSFYEGEQTLTETYYTN